MASAGDIRLASGKSTLARWFRRAVRHDAIRAYLLCSPILVFLFVALLLPLLALVVISFWTQVNFEFDRTLSLENYRTILAVSDEAGNAWLDPFSLLKNPIYLRLLARSVQMAFIATAAVVVLAYPLAYFLAFKIRRHKFVWLIVITLPFWTSYLLRVFAWKIILGFNGVINSGLLELGIIREPLEILLYNPAAVTITLAHTWAAFAVLPIYVSLQKIDRSLLEAATDLGDGPVRRFFRVTLPLSLPGTITAVLLVFIPTVGDYVTPHLVGGTSGLMIGNMIQALFGKANNAPLGAAVSIVSMVVTSVLVLSFLAVVHLLRTHKRAI